MNQTKKELSYFRLKLEGYLRDHHPELVANSAFIGARADLALSSYCDSVAQGFSHLKAEAMASEVLYQGLHFSKYDTLVSILMEEFSEELPDPFLVGSPPSSWATSPFKRSASKHPLSASGLSVISSCLAIRILGYKIEIQLKSQTLKCRKGISSAKSKGCKADQIYTLCSASSELTHSIPSGSRLSQLTIIWIL